MTYFEDLSDYIYGGSRFRSLGTKSVGWLEPGYKFPRATPTNDLLDVVWEYCKISIAQTRGLHNCEFCPPGDWFFAERHGERLTLGSSEIRVFGTDGVIYAAPTLLYHYISAHHYKPPDEFVRALVAGPRPPNQEYFDQLHRLGLKCNETFVPAVNASRFKFSTQPMVE